jgi:hypothetical protein
MKKPRAANRRGFCFGGKTRDEINHLDLKRLRFED